MFGMEAKDAISSAVLVLGLAGAVWKWGFERWVLRRREIPTLDGDIEVRTVPWRDGFVSVEIAATWTNKGAATVYADPKQTYVQIVEIDPAADDGDVLFSNVYTADGRAVLPLEDCDFFVLLPGTSVPVNVVVCLPENRTYVARCVLFARMSAASRRKVEAWVGGKAPYISWMRSRLFSTRPPPQPEAAART